MTFFYGKKYFIEQAAPNANEYDYALEILAPMKDVGISFRRNQIIKLRTPQSQQNIVYGSRIIQINEVAVDEKTGRKQLEKLLNNAKQSAPSYIVFRSNTESINKGTHLQFDVAFDENCTESKFPYYRFTKTLVSNIFDSVFDGLSVEIMEIYANKQSFNGMLGCGVSILLFVDDDTKSFKNYELFDKAEQIEEMLRQKGVCVLVCVCLCTF